MAQDLKTSLVQIIENAAEHAAESEDFVEVERWQGIMQQNRQLLERIRAEELDADDLV